MTLLLLPAIVLGAVAVKIARYAMIAVFVLAVLAGVLAWMLVRRRR
ncbi:hypothetical protein [Caulobacter sp. S45]|nr:hypothetical protein [Caulobacter sp. S45]